MAKTNSIEVTAAADDLGEAARKLAQGLAVALGGKADQYLDFARVYAPRLAAEGAKLAAAATDDQRKAARRAMRALTTLGQQEAATLGVQLLQEQLIAFQTALGVAAVLIL